MKNEDRIVELLSEMLIKQDAFVDGLNEVKKEIAATRKIQIRQENHLIKILEILADDVPKFDQVIEPEELKEGKIVSKRVHV